MSRADELWEKYGDDALGLPGLMTFSAFKNALEDYGADVRESAVSLCKRNLKHEDGSGLRDNALLDCANLIELMKLP